MNQTELLRKKESIEEAKANLAELTGQKKELLKRLEKEYGCKTLDEAKTKLEELREKRENLTSRINKKTEKLVKTYFEED